jgi:hypothetical protein
MTEPTDRADAIPARKTLPCLSYPLLILIGLLASTRPAMACDDALPPPGTLALQKALVESLQTYVKGVREEERVGQRTVIDVEEAEEDYFLELEIQRAMEACYSGDKANARTRALKARIETASDYLAMVKSWLAATEDRFNAGEVTKTDIAFTRATALSAEIRLAALKKEAGQ